MSHDDTNKGGGKGFWEQGARGEGAGSKGGGGREQGAGGREQNLESDNFLKIFMTGISVTA